MDTGVTLGYWNGFKGLGEGIRLILEYTGVKYHNKFYEYTPGKVLWAEGDKLSLGFDFPNLPYIIDGTEKVTESEACVYYVVAKAGKKELFGKNDHAATQVITLKGVTTDLVKDYFPLVISKDFDNDKKAVFDKIIPRLDNLYKFLGDKKFFVGDLTVFDFNFYYHIHVLAALDATLLEKYPNFKTFISNFEAIPEIAAYRASDRYKVQGAMPGQFVTKNATF